MSPKFHITDSGSGWRSGQTQLLGSLAATRVNLHALWRIETEWKRDNLTP